MRLVLFDYAIRDNLYDYSHYVGGIINELLVSNVGCIIDM